MALIKCVVSQVRFISRTKSGPGDPSESARQPADHPHGGTANIKRKRQHRAHSSLGQLSRSKLRVRPIQPWAGQARRLRDRPKSRTMGALGGEGRGSRAGRGLARAAMPVLSEQPAPAAACYSTTFSTVILTFGILNVASHNTTMKGSPVLAPSSSLAHRVVPKGVPRSSPNRLWA